ncbi:DNA-methyltransferase [Nanoarchaeota archaeon]
MAKHIVKLADCRELIKEFPEKHIDLIVTSPPYWAKRVYNGKDELGAENTPEGFVKGLADYFDQFIPYLKETANVFVNVGDTFFGSGAGAWKKYLDKQGNITEHQKKRKEKYFTLKPLQPKIKKNGKLYQNKQLLMIPSRFAIEMQNRGWILRSDIIWLKPNRIPASVTDRVNNMHEHVFHFVRKNRYFFDLDSIKVIGLNKKLKNPGDVWPINTQPLKGSHTATFPEELVEKIIKCGSPKNGIVFDPFMGTGTSWIVSERLSRKFIGAEINKEFFDFAHERFAESFNLKDSQTKLM